MSENSIVPFNPEASLKMIPIAERLCKSGLYQQFKTPESVFAIIQYGSELGIGPMMSLQNINLISGKPLANGQILLSLAINRGVKYKVIENSEQKCTINFTRNGSEVTSSFTIEEAKKAGLCNKDSWKNYPKAMLFWRASTQGIRMIAPDAIMGLYMPDEIEDVSDIKVGPEQAKNVSPQQPQTPEPVIVEVTPEQLWNDFFVVVDTCREEIEMLLQTQNLDPFKATEHYHNAVKKWMRDTITSAQVAKIKTPQGKRIFIDSFYRHRYESKQAESQSKLQNKINHLQPDEQDSLI